MVEEVLDALARSGLLARTLSGRDIGYLPARDPETIRASDLRDAIRRDRLGDDIRAGVERRLGPEIARVLVGLEDDLRRSPHNLTLRELAEAARGRHDGGPRAERAPAANGGGADTLDAKQPEVPR